MGFGSYDEAEQEKHTVAVSDPDDDDAAADADEEAELETARHDGSVTFETTGISADDMLQQVASSDGPDSDDESAA